jgi:PPOX class probable F420-dependent enzyme
VWGRPSLPDSGPFAYHRPMATDTPILSADAREFLAAPRFATIATVAPDGAPHQAVIWYLLDGDHLIVNSRPERRWPHNLATNPHISLAIYEAERPEHWFGLKGRAELLHEGPEATADIQAMARLHGKDPQTYEGQVRVSYRIHIASVFEYGR